MRRRNPSRRGRGRRPAAEARGATQFVFIERKALDDPIVVEVDRPMAYRPRLVGFWRGKVFYLVTRVVSTRREHDVTYHRVLTDRGAYDLRYVRRMDPVSLRARRQWEVCAELEALPVAPLG